MKPRPSSFAVCAARAARNIVNVALFPVLALCVLNTAAQTTKTEPGLVAHEWGTFTSVAGETGEAVEWLPLNGPSDLPSFVEHFRGAVFKLGLGGRLRMETPVIYFYSSRDTHVDVSVSFLHGLITEWYPRASHIEPSTPNIDAVDFQQRSNGSIRWTSVSVEPSAAREFRQENQLSHYYAARATEAAPLTVGEGSGTQAERFLFYRGVSETAPPLTATLLPHDRIEVSNQADDEIPLILRLECRSGKIGFGQFSGLQTSAILEPPLFDSSPKAVRAILEAGLISAGLYPAEARAMLATWHDSWFEEGSRLIYIVPSSYVSKILPLNITPRPSELHRVFVGRIELLTPATEAEVKTATVQHDEVALKQKYGRFLPAFLETMLRKNPQGPETTAIRHLLSGIYDSYLAANIAASR